MSATAAAKSPPSRPVRVTGDDGLVGRAASRLLPFVPLVQACLTLAGLAALVAIVVAGPQNLAPPLYLLVLAVPLLFAAGAGLSTVWTFRRTSRGRVLAIIVDYLAFLAAFLLLLHLLGVFVGFDDLADVFGATLPWLALALLAFVLGYALDALAKRPGLHRAIGLLRRGLFVVAAVGFLAAIDAGHGAVELLKDLADPLNLTPAPSSASSCSPSSWLSGGPPHSSASVPRSKRATSSSGCCSSRRRCWGSWASSQGRCSSACT